MADIAAPNPIADKRTHRSRNRVGALREVGDAAVRVDCVVAAQRTGRTRLDAARALATAFAQRRIRRQFERSNDFAEKNERAECRCDEIRMLADPTQAGSRGESSFRQGARIAGDRRYRRAGGGVDFVGDRAQQGPRGGDGSPIDHA